MTHLKKVEIENIRGIRHMVIDLAAITVIRGSNGSGKTSVIEAIRQGLCGGYDPLAVHSEADEGVITLTADDGTVIKRTINRVKRNSRLTITSAAGEVIPAPQNFVNELAGQFSYDPFKLLRCSPKERYQYLKESLTIDVDISELTAITAKHFLPDDVVLSNWSAKSSGLDRIAQVRKGAYDRRRAINRQFSDLEGAIRTMQLSVPSLNEDGTDWKQAEAQLSQQLSTAKSLRASALQQANDEMAAAREGIDSWEREELAKIRAAAAARRETIVTAHSAAVAQIQQEHDPGIAEMGARHAKARQQLSDYDRAVGARDAIAKLQAELEQHRIDGDRLTFVIEDIDALERSKLAASPAPGVELRDGEIFIDGIPFDGVNTQRQYEVAIQLGAANAGQMRAMICDEIEHWDSANFAALEQAARDSGFQLICAAVDDVPLTVETR